MSSFLPLVNILSFRMNLKVNLKINNQEEVNEKNQLINLYYFSFNKKYACFITKLFLMQI